VKPLARYGSPGACSASIEAAPLAGFVGSIDGNRRYRYINEDREFGYGARPDPVRATLLARRSLSVVLQPPIDGFLILQQERTPEVLSEAAYCIQRVHLPFLTDGRGTLVLHLVLS